MTKSSPPNPYADSPPWSVRMADSTMRRFPTLAEEWNYPWGLVLNGFERVWAATGDERYFAYIQRNVDRFVQADGAIRGYRLEEYNVDRLNPGKVLFMLYESTGARKYKTALDLLRRQLDTHPRTLSGGFWHKQIYPYQMWLDGIYMADAFYAQYESTFASNLPQVAIRGFDDVAHQITLIDQHTRDPMTGLLYHAWDESKQQRWANPETGCSPHFWGRAIGWFVMALVDVLDHMPPDYRRRDEIIVNLNQTMNALERVQDAKTGLWYQVLDQPGRAGNYLESSAACMFVYAMLKGVRQNYLPIAFRSSAQGAFDGILKHFVQVDDASQVHLTDTCRSAGLGGTPYRNGSFAYYVGEPRETDNHHGVGAFILASTEIEQI